MAHHIRICGKGVSQRAQSLSKQKLREVGFMSESPDLEPAKFRENPTAIAAYLTEAFDKNDLGAVVLAINLVMRAQMCGRWHGLRTRRDLLYKTFSGNLESRLSRVMGCSPAWTSN